MDLSPPLPLTPQVGQTVHHVQGHGMESVGCAANSHVRPVESRNSYVIRPYQIDLLIVAGR